MPGIRKYQLFYQLYVSSGYSLAEYGFLRICKFHSYSRNTGREDRHHSSLLFRFKLLFGPGADSVQIDKIQYPDRKVVERCAMIRDFGDKTKEVLDIWSRIKGDNLGVGITILIFVVVALMSGWMIYKKWQRYNRQKQQRRRSRRKRSGRN